MPPKAKEFQRIVREILDPAMRGAGFSRPSSVGLGGWSRKHGDCWLVAWTQLSRGNYGDTSEGYQFIVECQVGTEPIAGSGVARARLYELLTDDERIEHLRIHNDVIVKTSPNPRWLTGDGNWYVARFQPRPTPFEPFEDVWFTYTDEDDVRRWLTFVAEVLPEAIDRFAASLEDHRPTAGPN